MFLSFILQQLCSVPEIANSDEMQEFLALNTDARIAFVKKPFIVSRIDKVSTVCFFSNVHLQKNHVLTSNALCVSICVFVCWLFVCRLW